MAAVDPAAARPSPRAPAAPPAPPAVAAAPAPAAGAPKRPTPKTTVIDQAWGDFAPSAPSVAPPPPPLEEEITAPQAHNELLDIPVDDLDGETNVLSGQDLGRIPVTPAPAPVAAPAPAPVAAPVVPAAPAPVAAVTPAPARVAPVGPAPVRPVAPAIVPAPAAAPAPAPAPAPVAAAPMAPRVALVVAVRVAVVGREGEIRVVPLAPGQSPPPGTAVALLVPAGDEDAAVIGRLVGL